MMTGQKEKEKRVCCPYCDEEMQMADLPYCKLCGLTVFYCPECKKPISRDKDVCPECGAEIKG